MNDESTTAPEDEQPEGTETTTETEQPTGGRVEFSPEQQAHIDSLISKAHGKAKGQAEREFKAWLEEQSLTAEQQAQAEAQRAAAERDEARREALSVRVETSAERLALRAGVKPDRVDRFLKLVDLTNLDELAPEGKADAEAIEAAVKATLADVPEFAGTAAGDSSGSSTPSGVDLSGAGGTPKKWTREAIAKLSPDEYEQHKEEIFAQLGAGAISK